MADAPSTNTRLLYIGKHHLYGTAFLMLHVSGKIKTGSARFDKIYGNGEEIGSHCDSTVKDWKGFRVVGSMHRLQFQALRDRIEQEYKKDKEGWCNRVIEYLIADTKFPDVTHSEESSAPQT